MARRTRVILTIGLLAVAVASGFVFRDWDLQQTPPPQRATPTPPPLTFSPVRPAVVTCGRCHIDVYLEWEDSLHRAAWTNANVQQATNGFAKVECRACHSPQPVLAHSLEHRPLFRPQNLEDGVHCLSCHGLESGGVAAARTIPGAPCRPKRTQALSDRMMCNPCHQPTHNAMAEFVQSQAFRFGQSCHDCHMPRVERKRDNGFTYFGRSHGSLGGLNAAFVRKALAWKCHREGRAVVVTLGNQTGHKFPGEIPSRSLVLRFDFLRSDGSLLDSLHQVYRKSHKTEPDRPDNRLTPNEFRDIRVPFPPGASSVKVTILFKPFPLMPDEEAFVLGEWESE